ncbi:MAG: trypsin-like peptidase domain-containing protein [Oligoflexia bacterium]|nr:trypsin-like peptidase domain-containing protein [Oligoflexia bacterium]
MRKLTKINLWLSIALLLGAVLVVLPSIGRNSANAGSDSPAPRTEEEERTIQVYKNTNEAVVFITTITLTVDPFDVGFQLKPREGTGSGVIIDAAKGIVLTNLHVIQDVTRNEQISIMLANSQNYSARLVGYDQEYDIAVLQLHQPPEKMIAAKFGDSSKLEVGQRVLAIGNPFGLDHTLTTGIISSLNRTVKSSTGSLLKGLVQTDAAINPGNSGGPLLDMDGRLIGINTAILSQSGDSAGIGFAVPINQIKRVLPELIATGKVLRPDMGWVLVDTVAHGPMVRRVMEGGPAAEAGIQPIERPVDSVFLKGYVTDVERADLIVKVNGQKVSSRQEVEEVIAAADMQDGLTLTLRRGGDPAKERTVKVKPVLR